MRGVGSLARGGDQVWFTVYAICAGRQGLEALKVHQGKGGGHWYEWKDEGVEKTGRQWALEEEMQALVDETQKLQKGTDHCNSLKFCLHSGKCHF